MTKQPEALRLADILDEPDVHYPGNFNTPKRANALLMGLAQEAADELRRLERINTDLLQALEIAVLEEREACAIAALNAPLKTARQDIREACANAIRARVKE